VVLLLCLSLIVSISQWFGIENVGMVEVDLKWQSLKPYHYGCFLSPFYIVYGIYTLATAGLDHPFPFFVH
jgi:hypothetical protein